MVPYWYKLLECKARGATGLTIPFLVGAQELLAVSNKLNISELVFDVSNNSVGEVMLRYCNQTRDFIMTVSSNFILHKSYINHIAFGNLLVVPEKNLKGLDELEHIIISLELDYNSLMEQRDYSIVNGEPQEFSKDDLLFIRKCLKVQ